MAGVIPSEPRSGDLSAAVPFGGYILVALVVAWIAGIALRGLAPVSTLQPAAWLVLAVVLVLPYAAVATLLRLAKRPLAGTGRVTLLALLLGCALMLGAARATAADPRRDPLWLGYVANGQTVRLHAAVSAEPDIRDGYRLLTADVSAVSSDAGRTWAAAHGSVQVAIAGPTDWYAPQYGDTLELTGTLTRSTQQVSGGVPALRLTGARASILARGGGNPVLAHLFALRAALAQAIQRALPEPEASLLIGILLGLKTPLLRSRLSLFTATGTIHLVVPAGLKVAVLAEIVSSVVRPFGRWPRALAGLLAVGLYAALGGGGPAAVRAAVMAGLLVLAPALGRRYNVFTALALAALAMTVVEPALIYDAGFQLTLLATLGLPLLVPGIERPLASALSWLHLPAAGTFAELLAVTIAAQVATLPVLAMTFGEISLVAPLANLLTVPLLAVVLVLGIVVALASALAGVAGGPVVLLCAWVAWPPLAYMDAAIQACARAPWAALAIPGLGAGWAFAYYAILVAWRWWPRRTQHDGVSALTPAAHTHGVQTTGQRRSAHGFSLRVTLAGLLVLVALGSCGAVVPHVAGGDVARLSFLDLGPGGSAILFQLPTGATMLVDGGPSGPALEVALADHLPLWRRSLDVCVLTDVVSGAARGLDDVTAILHVGAAVDAGMAHPNAEYLAWLNALHASRVPHHVVTTGNAIRLDSSTTLQVLWPLSAGVSAGATSSAASETMITRLITPGLRALFLGAANDTALDALAGSGADLSADVVELAITPGAPLESLGPLGDVLRAAHPRLIVLRDAPVAPTSLAALQAAASHGRDDDAADAVAFNAQIVRVADVGGVELSGGPAGWILEQ